MNTVAIATANTAALISSGIPIARAKTADAALSTPVATTPNHLDAVIADIIARILQRSSVATQTSDQAHTANASARIILTQLLNPTNSAASMDLNLNQLLNSAVLQKVIAQLPPELLARPQVIEALVLQNTLLPAGQDNNNSALPILILPASNTATAQTANLNTLYRVSVEWQNRLLQLLSAEPLPIGSRVQLQINARGEIALLPPAIAAKILLQQSVLTNPTPQQTQPAALTPAQAIQQSLRELLPRQEALHVLVPLLQKFIQPALREQLPQPVFKALAQLLQSLPKPAQLQNAENLKQTLQNSGNFFEARLARALVTQTTSENAAAESLPKLFTADLKAQIGALLGIIHKFVSEMPTSPRATPFAADSDPVYDSKPATHNATAHNTQSSEAEKIDSLLTQLSKLLQAGFARIQLNQLDSASARHLNHETQTPVPTWVLELPLRTPHGVDQLQLRIEQRQKQQQQRTRVQWNVQIAFDLHAAGKLAATLAIVDKTVSATLWAEREQTHRRVREEMDYLRAGLESVGVKVTEMQCRLGLPAPRSNPISQQLVDIHT
jgi:hypothetical protein